MSATQNRSRLSEMLLAQSVRMIEETGPLEDSEAMSQAFRSRSGREERLLERAWLLGQRLGLAAEIERWRELALYIWAGLSLFVFFIAYGIAAAMIGGDRSLNAVLAFWVALGMHAVTLLIWLLALVTSGGSQRGSIARLSLGGLSFRLLAWLPFDRSPHSLTMLRAATALLQRARLLPWAFGFISHTIWAVAFVLVLIALWFAFSFREYRLTWETTILSADFFVGFVQVTGRLPQLLGFPLPDTATLLNPGLAGSGQRAWALWLIGCTLVYGLLPRLLLAGVSRMVWQHRQRSISLDTSDPYFRKLLTRFDAMETSTVVDREQRPDPAPPGTVTAPNYNGQTALALIGFELPEDTPWPPAALASVVSDTGMTMRITGASEERRAVLNRLAQIRPRKLLLACNSVSSPDRGTERFVREASAHAMHCALLLLPLAGSGSGNPQRWQTWLSDTGLHEIEAFTSLESLADWFRPEHG